MNEIANVCERFGGDADKVRQAIGSDKRIGPAFLFPGIGYGGSCFAKDVKALMRSAEDHGYDFKILHAVEAVNQAQKERLVEKMQEHFAQLSGKTIALWGLAFKPRTDDMREAPAIQIIEGIRARGGKVRAFDPEARKAGEAIFGRKIYYAKNAYDALKDADALLVVTEWNVFREPDFQKMKRIMKNPLILDGRNIFSPRQMRDLGFTYASIGRP